MSARIRFQAADIPVEGMPMDVDLSSEWLSAVLREDDDSIRLAGEDEPVPGRLRGRLSRSGNDIVVRGRVIAAVVVPCVRCLEPAAVDVDADLSLLLQPQAHKGAGHRGGPRKGAARKGGRRQAAGSDLEHEFHAADADLDSYDGETVVLDDFVRELILLEVPSFPLCRDACPGIHHLASREQPEPPAVDPRLAPLGAFRKKGDGPVTIEDLVNAATERSAALGRKPVLKANRAGRSRKKRNKG